MRARYGIIGDPEGIERVDAGVLRRLVRIRHLDERRSEIETEIRALRAEIGGLESTLEMLAAAAVARIRHERGEVWSPVAMTGYRLWDSRPDGFHGFRVQWRTHTLTAECPTTGTWDEIPHTDDRCGDPPCGIYAAKDLGELLDSGLGRSDVNRTAVGLVALSGKVVEHRGGYRGELAEVVALAYPRDGILHMTADMGEIRRTFEGISLPDLAGGRNTPLETGRRVSNPAIRDAIESFLTSEEQRRRDEWISESPNV